MTSGTLHVFSPASADDSQPPHLVVREDALAEAFSRAGLPPVRSCEQDLDPRTLIAASEKVLGPPVDFDTLPMDAELRQLSEVEMLLCELEGIARTSLRSSSPVRITPVNLPVALHTQTFDRAARLGTSLDAVVALFTAREEALEFARRFWMATGQTAEFATDARLLDQVTTADARTSIQQEGVVWKVNVIGNWTALSARAWDWLRANTRLHAPDNRMP